MTQTSEDIRWAEMRIASAVMDDLFSTEPMTADEKAEYQQWLERPRS